jgi:hypothetical protein
MMICREKPFSECDFSPPAYQRSLRSFGEDETSSSIARYYCEFQKMPGVKAYGNRNFDRAVLHRFRGFKHILCLLVW